MKERAKQMQLPPVYMGKWATATEAEIEAELAKGTPFTYRFRVPLEGSLKINDLIRGGVHFSFSYFNSTTYNVLFCLKSINSREIKLTTLQDVS
jgi:glutamyl/glutaminyl-tRNA synthetase